MLQSAVFSSLLLLQVVFLDGEGTYSHAAQQQEEPASLQRPGAQQQLTLHPHKWATALVEWKPRRPGRLKAQAVIAYTGDSSAISWSLEHVSPGVCVWFQNMSEQIDGFNGLMRGKCTDGS